MDQTVVCVEAGGDEVDRVHQTADYRRQLRHHIIIFATTLILLLVFIVLSRLLFPDSGVSAVLTKVLKQYVAAIALPVHENANATNSSTTAATTTTA
jgi:hypothetical protein